MGLDKSTAVPNNPTTRWSAVRAGLRRLAEVISIGCLAALLITLPFWRHRVLLHRGEERIFFEFQDIVLYTNDLLWLAAIGAWLASALLKDGHYRLRFGPLFLWLLLAGLLIVALAGAPLAVDPLLATYHWVRFSLLFISYLMVLNLPIAAGTVAWSMAIAMVLQAVVAVPQFLLGTSLGLRRLGEVNTRAAWPGASVVMAGEERWLRAYGLAQHPNLLAGCLMVMLLIVTGYYLHRSGWQRTPLVLAIGTGLTTLLLTFSRAAWLGLAMGGLVMAGLLWWARYGVRDNHPASAAPRKSLLLLSVVLLGVALAFALFNWPLIQPRLGLTSQGVEIRSVDARVLQLGAARKLIQLDPISGVGLGNYAIALFTLAQDAVTDYPVYQPVHNVPMLVTAELGLIGGALWLGLICAPWLAIWRHRRDLMVSAWWAGLSGALASLTIVSLFDAYVWSSQQGRLLFWLVLGLWGRAWLERIPLSD